MISPLIPIEPTAKQLEFYNCETTEALFFGGCGSGKTTALLMSALKYVDQPEYRGLVLCQHHRQIFNPGGLMDIYHPWLVGKATFVNSNKTWTFPSGASLRIDCVNERNWILYSGAEWNSIFIDNVTVYENSNLYEHMMSLLRRPKGSPIPLMMRVTGDMTGIGYPWVRERFLCAGSPGRVVCMSLEDNPGINKEAFRKAICDESDVIEVNGKIIAKRDFKEGETIRMTPEQFAKVMNNTGVEFAEDGPSLCGKTTIRVATEKLENVVWKASRMNDAPDADEPHIVESLEDKESPRKALDLTKTTYHFRRLESSPVVKVEDFSSLSIDDADEPQIVEKPQ